MSKFGSATRTPTSGALSTKSSPNSPSAPSQNWRRVVEKYIQDNNLSEDEQCALQVSDPRDLTKDLEQIEMSKLQASRVNKYLQKSKPFLDCIERFSPALDVFANADPHGVLSLLWGSIRMVFIVARDLSNFYEDILEFFTEMEDSLGRLAAYESLFKRNMRFNKALCAVFEQVLDFCSWLRSQFRSKVRVISKTLFTGSLKKDAKLKIAHFKSLCVKTESEAQLADTQSGQDFQKQAMQSLKKITITQRLEAKKSDAFMRNAFVKEFYEKLSPLSIREQLETLQRKRLKGTCTWILESKEFRNLLSEEIRKSPQVTWITGHPGVGKTYLTAYLIGKLEEIRHVAYFFCDNSDVSRRSPLSIWRTMLWQLLSKTTYLIGEALRLISGAEITSKLLKQITRLVTKSDPSCFLIVDGLDEYDSETQEEVVEFLGDLSKEANVLIISRKTSGIERALHEVSSQRTVSRIKIQPQDTRQDIERFLRNEASKLKFDDPALLTKFVKVIGEKAHGMFLYARLALKDFDHVDTEDERHAALEQLPQGIDELYRRSLQNISKTREPRRGRILQLLRWVIFAARPMTIEELSTALATTPNESSFRRSNRPDVEKLFLDYCTSLLDLDELTNTLSLVHATAREFLLSSEPDSPAFREDTSHANLSSICLTYLNFERSFVDRSDVDTANIPTEEVWPWFEFLHPPFYLHLEDHPFLQYSAANWIFHLSQTTANRSLEPEDMQALKSLKSLLSSETRMLKWLELFHFMCKIDMDLSRASSDLFDAWLLQSETERLSQSKDLDDDDETKAVGEALSRFAFTFMSFPFVDTSGADKASKDPSIFFSPAQVAILGDDWKQACYHLGFSDPKGVFRWRRHMRIEYSPRKPIHLAAYFNYTGYMKEVLDDGEDVDLQDTQDRGPLDQACWGESLEAAKLLVRYGADVNRTPRFTFYDGSNPLVSSVVGDRTRQLRPRSYPLARYMLSVGAQVEGGISDLNPIHGMFDWFQETKDELEALNLILNHARNIETVLETPNPYTGILPLCTLARNNIPKATEIFLNRHTDPKKLIELRWGADGKCALHESCSHAVSLTGHLLLQYGPDYNTQTTVSLMTPLHVAAASRSNMFSILLNGAADITARDASGRTPLHIAAMNGWAGGVAELLHRRKSIVNETDNHGNTATDLASMAQNSDVLKVLWANGGKALVPRQLETSYWPNHESQIWNVAFILKQAFKLGDASTSLVCQIMDEAEYWLRQSVETNQPMVVMAADCGMPYLSTRQIRGHSSGPVRRFDYHIKSKAREGPLTAHMSKRKSWTWFDLGKHENAESSDGSLLVEEFCVPQPLASDRICVVTNSVDEEDLQVHEGHIYTANHEDSDSAMWLSRIKPGESISLIPMARWVDRVNTTFSCRMEIFTSPLPPHSFHSLAQDTHESAWYE